MSTNFFKISKGLTLKPQSSPPSNPQNGDLYYDSASNKFKFYENGSWVDFSSTGGSSGGTSTVVSADFNADNNKSYIVDNNSIAQDFLSNDFALPVLTTVNNFLKQPFEITNNNTGISVIKFKVKKTGNPLGYFTVSIYDNTTQEFISEKYYLKNITGEVDITIPVFKIFSTGIKHLHIDVDDEYLKTHNFTEYLSVYMNNNQSFNSSIQKFKINHTNIVFMSINAIAQDSNGNIYVGGDFTGINNVSANNIAKYNPSTNTWSALGTGTNGPVNAIASIGTDLYVGGLFTQAGSQSANSIARWDGSNWYSLGTGLDGPVYALASIGTDLYVGGVFTQAGFQPANNIARWNGSNWYPLGDGVSGGFQPSVRALATIGTDLYVGGEFQYVDTYIQANGFAKWNGSNWTTFSLSGPVIIDKMIANSTDVYLYNGYSGTIYRFDGTIFTSLFTSSSGIIRTLFIDNNYLYITGDQIYVSNNIYYNFIRYNLSNDTVEPLFTGSPSYPHGELFGNIINNNIYLGAKANINGIGAYIVKFNINDYNNYLPLRINFITDNGSDQWNTNQPLKFTYDLNNNAYAYSNFSTFNGISANNIIKYNPFTDTWSALGSGTNNTVLSAVVDNNNHLYIGGDFTTAGSQTVNRIAKWDGNTWLPLGSGANNKVSILIFNPPDNDLYVFGNFTEINSIPCNNFAKYNTITNTWTPLGVTLTGYYPVIQSAVLYNDDLYIGGRFASVNGISVNNIIKYNIKTNTFSQVVFNTDINHDVIGMIIYDGSLWVLLKSLRVIKYVFSDNDYSYYDISTDIIAYNSMFVLNDNLFIWVDGNTEYGIYKYNKDNSSFDKSIITSTVNVFYDKIYIFSFLSSRLKIYDNNEEFLDFTTQYQVKNYSVYKYSEEHKLYHISLSYQMYSGITATLPSTPTVGDKIQINLSNNSNGTVILHPNGSKINSVAQPFIVPHTYSSVFLYYVNNTVGWKTLPILSNVNYNLPDIILSDRYYNGEFTIVTKNKDVILCDASGNNVYIKLPLNPVRGDIITLINNNVINYNILVYSIDKFIENDNILLINTQFSKIQLLFNGYKWKVIA